MKLTITIDFDDTLQVKAFPEIAKARLTFFKAMANSGMFKVVVVTARSSHLGEVEQFIQKHRLNIDYIIPNAGDKLAVLQGLKTVAHFEDNEQIVKLLAKNGFNVFYMGEFLSQNMVREWRETLQNSGEWEFYVKDNHTKGGV